MHEKIVNELSMCDHIHVVCVGGELTPRNMSYIGRVAEKTIKENYYANKCFFSCRGVTLGRGLVDSSEGEAEIKKAMLRVVNQQFSFVIKIKSVK